MPKRYKNLIFLFTIITIFLSLSQPVLALEVSYPPLPGAPVITGDSSLVDYILYFFIFAVTTAAAIGIISIAIAGIQILIAAGSPAAVGAARERIFDSILGIILLMFSVILLRTINPEFINPQMNEFFLPPGVYLIGQGTVPKQAPQAVSNTSDPLEVNPEYTTLVYNCGPTESNAGKTLLVRTYGQTDFGVGNNGSTILVPCGSTGSINIKGSVLSFSWEYEDAGVYYYLNPGCEGISSEIQKSPGEIPIFGSWSIQDIAEPVLSMRIVSGSDWRTRYGVILNKNSDGSGECSPPIVNHYAGSVCYSGVTFPKDLDGYEFNPLYANVITYNPLLQTGKNKGVTLYSYDYFVRLKAIINLEPQFSVYEGYSGDPDNGFNGTPDDLLAPPCDPLENPFCFPPGGFGQTYTGDEPPDECTPFDPFQPCLNWVEPDGDFYTIFYARNDIDYDEDGFYDYTDRACKVFNNGVSGLSGEDFLSGEKYLYRMDIIPEIH